jgi:FHA domain
MDYEPISVGLKFGFIAVLYLFLLWIARSALKDLRRTAAPAPDATGLHQAALLDDAASPSEDAWLVVERGGGLKAGSRYDLFGGLSIGRAGDADVQIDDRYASGLHARIYAQRGNFYLEDLKSTNGTLLNDQALAGEAELVSGDMIRIGDTEFRFEPGS